MFKEVLDRYFAAHYEVKECTLPLSFGDRSKFTLHELTLFGERYLLAEACRPLSFSEIDHFRFVLAKSNDRPAVFYLPKSPAPLYRRLVKEVIPFLSEDHRYFIPGKLVLIALLDEKKSRPLDYSLFFQPVIAYFLLHPSAETNSGLLLGIFPSLSRSTLILALRYLRSIGFLAQKGAGRSTLFALALPRNEAFHLILPLLKSPLVRSYYAEGKDTKKLAKAIFSSESALALYSDVSPLEESYLLSKEDYGKYSDILCLSGEKMAEKNYTRFDLLAYPPYLYNKNGNLSLNPLDVIAIYKNNDDPRIVSALGQMEDYFR
jgi:hypothetical protein